MTDYLGHVSEKFGLQRVALEPLTRTLEESGSTRIVDLCSGAGGMVLPILTEWAEKGRPIPTVLTDLYPNQAAAESAATAGGPTVEYHRDPIDARAVPAELTGLRTLFNSFHHLRPVEAKAVLSDTVRAKQAIAVFEVADRSVPMIISLIFVPLFVLVLTPFIRPFRWSRLFWTYLIPVLPLLILWDGLVSYLRAYTPDELLAMANQVEPHAYKWASGYQKAANVPGRMTYLTGVPSR